jgi:hypothetical protein
LLPPNPIKPFLPIENPAPVFLAPPGKSAFLVHEPPPVVSYSQKSLKRVVWLVSPVPIYPLPPIENPTANDLPIPPKSAFLVHVSVA